MSQTTIVFNIVCDMVFFYSVRNTLLKMCFYNLFNHFLKPLNLDFSDIKQHLLCNISIEK